MFVIIIRFFYIYVSQGGVKMHLWCGRIYNNCIIANCLQSVPVKKFLNWSIIGEDMVKSKVPRFYGPRCIYQEHLYRYCDLTKSCFVQVSNLYYS